MAKTDNETQASQILMNEWMMELKKLQICEIKAKYFERRIRGQNLQDVAFKTVQVKNRNQDMGALKFEHKNNLG